MRSAADLASELDEGLKQLFDAGLALSLEVQKNAMAAEPAEQARLGLTFHRLSRGVRQTAALRMKIAREAERSGRETAAEVISLAKARVQKRRAEVQTTIDRLIWAEAESDDADLVLRFQLDELLDIEVQDPDAFEAEDLEDQIQRLCKIIGFNSPTLAATKGPPQSTPAGGGSRSEGGRAASGSEGEVSAKPTEGVEAPDRPASEPPQSLRDSSPSGGASGDDDPLLADDYWKSSA